MLTCKLLLSVSEESVTDPSLHFVPFRMTGCRSVQDDSVAVPFRMTGCRSVQDDSVAVPFRMTGAPSVITLYPVCSVPQDVMAGNTYNNPGETAVSSGIIA